MAKQAASQTKKPREKKTTDANGMPKEFDVSTAPRVSLEFGNAWFAVDRRSAEMPNLPMPTYQTGSKIYLQHTAENVAFLMTYNNVENRQWVETQWPNLYRATDNADRFDLMQQCKANESALVPALRKRLADGGFECWDWLRSHQVLCLYLGLLNNSLGLLLDMGTGKAQPLSATVYTPQGPKTMGEMAVGDLVCTPDGKTAPVTGVYPQGLRPVYRVSFNDGTGVLCDEEHLWAVQTPVMKKRGQGFKVKSTKELARDLHSGPNLKWFVPMTEPLAFCERDLPLDPYLLGALLGDGSLTTSTISITKDNPHFIARLETRLPGGHYLQDKTAGTYAILSQLPGCNLVARMVRELKINTKSVDKHIPQEYLHASVAQRIDLLQGLMDTDGTCTKNNRTGEFVGAAYSTSSPTMAKDFCFLVQSLGGVARVSVKKQPAYTYNGEKHIGAPNHVINVSLPASIMPFATDPKRSRYTPNTKYLPARGITAINFIGMQPTQCIHIDHPDHLYVTDNATVTHNTVLALQIAANRIRRRDTEAVLLVIPATLYNTWQSEIDKLRAMYNDPIYELVQLSGVAEERRYQLKHCRGPFFAINYEMLAPLMPEICAKQFNMLIFDESSKIKSHTARMTQASWYLAQRARYKLILNGTPYSKSLTDLHSQLNVLQLGSLFKPLPPNPFVFEHRFTNKSGFNLTPKPGAVEAVNRALYSYSVRYVSEECLELPERTIQNVFCDMTPKQWDVYREVEAQAFTEVQDSVVKAENRLTTLSKVFQITSGFVNDVNGKPILFEPKAPKLEALREMIAGTDRSIIIFAWHVFLLEMLYDEYSKDAVLFHGGVSKNDKTLAEKRFQAGERRIFFGQEQAAGKGLNLQVAPYSIFLEKNHSYENYIQALKRNHRGGQKHPCFGYNLMVQDTIDTDIQDVVDARAVDADAALVTVTRNMARRVGRR